MNLSINLNKVEVGQMWTDITKFLSVVITIHILLYIVDDYGELFNETILKLLLYLVLGLVVYHLIVKKFVDKQLVNCQPKQIKQVKQIKKPIKKISRKRQVKPKQKNCNF